jgi:hypothetical protein
MQARVSSLVFLICVFVSATATAGPWVQLPDAVAQLQVNPRDRAAVDVLDSTADSIRAEAQRGNLPAVSVMMEVYSSLVMRLPDGDRRLQEVAVEVARALVAAGERVRDDDVQQAAAAWTLAATYDPVRVRGGSDLAVAARRGRARLSGTVKGPGGLLGQRPPLSRQ